MKSASSRWHSKQSGRNSWTFESLSGRFVRNERCSGGDKLPVRSKRRYSLCHRRRSNCCRIEPLVGNERFKLESDPVEAALAKPFTTMVDGDEPNDEYDDEVGVRSRDCDSNDGGTRSRAGGDGADDAFKSEQICFCVAN